MPDRRHDLAAPRRRIPGHEATLDLHAEVASAALLLARGSAADLVGGDLGSCWVRCAEAPLAAMVVTARVLVVRRGTVRP